MEEEKKHVPKFSLFLFFLWDFSLKFYSHRERAKKGHPGGKKKHRGETDATHKKKESAQPGARTQDLSLTIPECFWCLLLGERSNQTELAELSLLSFERV